MTTPEAKESAPGIFLVLSASEIAVLAGVAGYYQKSLGPWRVLARFAMPREIRTRYRFIADESALLEHYVESLAAELDRRGGDAMNVELTAIAFVALWGRLLSSLNSRRSRRRTRPHELQAREAVELKFREAASMISGRTREVLLAQIQTRKLTEVQWMVQRLSPSEPGEATA